MVKKNKDIFSPHLIGSDETELNNIGIKIPDVFNDLPDLIGKDLIRIQIENIKLGQTETARFRNLLVVSLRDKDEIEHIYNVESAKNSIRPIVSFDKEIPHLNVSPHKIKLLDWKESLQEKGNIQWLGTGENIILSPTHEDYDAAIEKYLKYLTENSTDDFFKEGRGTLHTDPKHRIPIGSLIHRKNRNKPIGVAPIDNECLLITSWKNLMTHTENLTNGFEESHNLRMKIFSAINTLGSYYTDNQNRLLLTDKMLDILNIDHESIENIELKSFASPSFIIITKKDNKFIEEILSDEYLKKEFHNILTKI